LHPVRQARENVVVSKSVDFAFRSNSVADIGDGQEKLASAPIVKKPDIDRNMALAAVGSILAPDRPRIAVAADATAKASQGESALQLNR